jgi:predicted permease
LQAFLGRLADASIALGLIAVGAALRLHEGSGMRGLSLWLLGVKLLLVPLVAVQAAHWFGLSGLNFQIVVIFAAMPTASSAYILAMRMGGDGRSVAWLISATTLASMLTLPLWAAWLAG